MSGSRTTLVFAALAAVVLVACAPGSKSSLSSRSGASAAAAGRDGGAAGGTRPPAVEPVLLRAEDDPTVTFKVWFKVGAKDDPPGQEGLAYLTAEMISEGSTTKNSLDRILEKLYPLASTYSMTVDREMSVLTGRTHRDNLDAFFELFTDAYLRPAFSKEDFERVKSDTLNYLQNTLRYQADEELGKAALNAFVFEGTRYEHPVAGTVQGVSGITLDDVRDFYRRHYVAGNAVPALGGGFDDALVRRFVATVAALPASAGSAPRGAIPPVSRVRGNRVLLVDKPGADASISFGYPIGVRRGEREFYALWLANSWLGEHRNSSSHLYKVIRETRGMNYGDYSYIEAFPQGGFRSVPPVHVGRGRQMFEVWIRTLPDEQAHFALRAAVREVDRLVREGLTREQFELTREFLKKYILHFADTTQARLGYAVDDRFYGIGGKGHLARFRKVMDSLTLDEVNAAIRKHLRAEDLSIAIVTGEAASLREALATDAPSPMTYESEKPPEVLEEDREIERYPLQIEAAAIRTIPVDRVFER